MNVFTEKILEKLVYLFNTIDTYFLISGIFSSVFIAFLTNQPLPFFGLILSALFLWLIFKFTDFYLHYLFFLPIFLIFFLFLEHFDPFLAFLLFLTNVLFFFVTQFLFYSIPYVIILRDYTLPFRISFNSLFTFAPTSSSAVMSIYFSTLLSETITFFRVSDSFSWLIFFAFLLAAAITKKFVPFTFQSKNFKPKPRKLAERVIYLNIDGCRLDKFKIAPMPFVRKLEQRSAVFRDGALSVYRALTNPAFASILTGATPQETGVKNNNFHAGVTLEALPDLTETILYGNIHMQDIAKKHWNVKVISLPKYGLQSDDRLLDSLQYDLLHTHARLFIADLCDVDLAGHAYGSSSRHYLDALTRTDKRLESFFRFLGQHNLLNDSLVIISSDHGQAGMEHAYLFASSEKYVPLLFSGKGVKKKTLDFVPSIIDINLTISYVLGIPYCASSVGRVLIESFE